MVCWQLAYPFAVGFQDLRCRIRASTAGPRACLEQGRRESDHTGVGNGAGSSVEHSHMEGTASPSLADAYIMLIHSRH